MESGAKVSKNFEKRQIVIFTTSAIGLARLTRSRSVCALCVHEYGGVLFVCLALRPYDVRMSTHTSGALREIIIKTLALAHTPRTRADERETMCAR